MSMNLSGDLLLREEYSLCFIYYIMDIVSVNTTMFYYADNSCFYNMLNMLRRSARKSRLERIKNEYIKETMGVKEKTEIIDIIEKKRLQWYGHVQRMPEERIPKLIMEWIPLERRKRERPRKTWILIEGVQAAMITRNLEPDQWRNREECRLVSGRWRQLL